MLNLITGKQRSGKSYFCVTLIIDYLRHSKRPIYTNLPINPDVVADVACGGKIRNPALYNQYLLRLHLFVNYSGRNRSSFKIFKSINPDFCKFYHSSSKSDLRNHLFIPSGIHNSFISQFWRYTLSNSIIFLDEVYEIFGSLDQLSKGKDIRKEMLSYAKQHGHFKDDLYLITHDPADIDKIIRKSLNKQYIVKNSKYQNILDHRFFKGLRWPIQFFMVSGYEYGEKTAQDQFNIYPKQNIFSCYNSFNVSDFLDKEMASDSDVSSDTSVNHRDNWRNFAKQFFPLFIVSCCVLVGFLSFLYYGTKYFSNASSGRSVSSDQSSSKEVSSDVDFSSNSEPYALVKLVTPYSIVFSDGSRKILGDYIYGYKIEKIDKNSILFSSGSSYHRLPLSYFRRSPENIESKLPGGNISTKNSGESLSHSKSVGESSPRSKAPDRSSVPSQKNKFNTKSKK